MADGRAELHAAADAAARQATVPPMRPARTPAQIAAVVAATRRSRRRWQVRAHVAGALVTVAAAAGTVWLVHAEHAPQPRTARAAPAGPVDTSTPSGQGRAAAQQIVTRGGIVSVFSCEAAYELATGTRRDTTDEPPGALPTMSADERAYVDGCLGRA